VIASYFLNLSLYLYGIKSNQTAIDFADGRGEVPLSSELTLDSGIVFTFG